MFETLLALGISHPKPVLAGIICLGSFEPWLGHLILRNTTLRFWSLLICMSRNPDRKLLDNFFILKTKAIVRWLCARADSDPSPYGCAQANSLAKPIKWFNIGEHFRYERPQKGRGRSFYQFNADY